MVSYGLHSATGAGGGVIMWPKSDLFVTCYLVLI